MGANKTAMDGLNEGLLQHSWRVTGPIRAPAGSLNKAALYIPVWRNLERSKPKMATEKNHISCNLWWKWKLLSCVWLFATPRTVACQAPLSMGFSKQEYWSRLPCPSPEDLPNPGIKLRSPALQVGSYCWNHQVNLWWCFCNWVKRKSDKRARLPCFSLLLGTQSKMHMNMGLSLPSVVRSRCSHCWGPSFDPWLGK